jgi:hypothetical protein
MKTNPSFRIFKPSTLVYLGIAIAAALSLAHPAKATDIITTFDVSGTCVPSAPFTGTTFGGTLTIDVTAGTVTAIDVTFQGLSPFNTVVESFGESSSNWSLLAGNGTVGDKLSLVFTTTHTPASLVGFTGGPIFAGQVANDTVPTLFYFGIQGSITAPVPDSGSTLGLLSLSVVALLGATRLRFPLKLADLTIPL